MADPAVTAEPELVAEEARLARAAAAGDGEAFATLYERYARRAYNLALRLSGSEEDAADAVQEAFVKVMRRLPRLGEGELAFGSYLFTATRNATLDLMRSQRRAQPSDSIGEAAVPVGAGAGGLGLDPGDPDEDPDRRVLLGAQREQIQAANARLPARQREALALRELEEMSYDEIAVQMEMNRNSVAQLISRARINLRNELRGTALAAVAVGSPECERALPLIAMRDDGQLDQDGADAGWLAAHVAACERCALATEAMQEAGVSYRAWVPVAVAPWLFRETMARAAELSGSDWSAVVADRLGSPTPVAALPGLPLAYRGAAAAARGSRRRLAAALGALAALLLFGGAIALSAGGGGESPPAAEPPAADVAVEQEPPPSQSAPKQHKRHKQKKERRQAEPERRQAAEPAPAPVAEPVIAEPVPAAPTTTAKPKSATKPEPVEETRNGGIDKPKAVAEPTEPEPEPQPQPEPEPEPQPEPTPPPATPPVETAPEPTPPGPNDPPVGGPFGPAG